jgi:hypothetical protein
MQTAGVLLVVVEKGAVLPTWIGRCQDRVSDVFVVVGNAEEPADALLKRVEQRLNLLTGSEHQRGFTVLVAAGGRPSVEVEQSRIQVADRLQRYLAELGQGLLLLLTDESASLESRVQLLSMAGVLAQQVRGTRISINVRFGSLHGDVLPPELLASTEPPLRRASRRPPAESGQMLRPSAMPQLHKAPTLLPKRRVGNAS